jgi:hypothetical protein
MPGVVALGAGELISKQNILDSLHSQVACLSHEVARLLT